MIPPYIYSDKATYGVLPPGVHEASLSEIEERFAITAHRMSLFRGIVAVAINLKDAGCTMLYLDGSYVTEKEIPSDFDGCWEPKGVIARMLDPVLLNFDNKRAAQKAKYGGELFPSSWPATQISDKTFFQFFQQNKETGEPKGLIGLRLDTMT